MATRLLVATFPGLLRTWPQVSVGRGLSFLLGEKKKSLSLEWQGPVFHLLRTFRTIFQCLNVRHATSGVGMAITSPALGRSAGFGILVGCSGVFLKLIVFFFFNMLGKSSASELHLTGVVLGVVFLVV